MEITKARDAYKYYTGKASDCNRSLSFAGIAVIWIFRTGEQDQPHLPKVLILALGLFAVSLAFDLLHYLVSSAIWGTFHRFKEKSIENENDDIQAPPWINWPGNFFFWMKFLYTIAGYSLLGYFISIEVMS